VTTSLDKSRIKIVLLEGVHDRAVENFARHGYRTVKRYKKALAGAELREAVADAHFVGIRSRTRLTRG
jgi:D-3-phosphoglycerate dehydrogenase